MWFGFAGIEFMGYICDTSVEYPPIVMIKYNPAFQKKLEDIFEENGYKVRFEKGNFKSGFCIIEDKKVVVLNKFAVIESRINSMIEILRILSLNGQVEGEKLEQIRPYFAKQQSLEVTD